jgi:hypothetical protein
MKFFKNNETNEVISEHEVYHRMNDDDAFAVTINELEVSTHFDVYFANKLCASDASVSVRIQNEESDETFALIA